MGEVSGDSRELGPFIFQRLSITIQRSNATPICSMSHSIWTSSHFTFALNFFFYALSGPLRADPWHGCILVKYGSRIDRHRPIADPIRGRRALVHSNLAQ